MAYEALSLCFLLCSAALASGGSGEGVFDPSERGCAAARELYHTALDAVDGARDPVYQYLQNAEVPSICLLSKTCCDRTVEQNFSSLAEEQLRERVAAQWELKTSTCRSSTFKNPVANPSTPPSRKTSRPAPPTPRCTGVKTTLPSSGGSREHHSKLLSSSEDDDGDGSVPSDIDASVEMTLKKAHFRTGEDRDLPLFFLSKSIAAKEPETHDECDRDGVLARRKQLLSEAPGWSVAHPSQSQTIKGGSKVTFSDSMSLSRKVPASLLPSSAPIAPSRKTSDTPQPSSALGNSVHCGGYHSNLSQHSSAARLHSATPDPVTPVANPSAPPSRKTSRPAPLSHRGKTTLPSSEDSRDHHSKLLSSSEDDDGDGSDEDAASLYFHAGEDRDLHGVFPSNSFAAKEPDTRQTGEECDRDGVLAGVPARRKQLQRVAHPSQSQTIKGGSKATSSDSISLSRKAPASLLPSSAPSQKTSDTPQPSSAVGNSRHCGGYHSNLSRSNAASDSDEGEVPPLKRRKRAVIFDSSDDTDALSVVEESHLGEGPVGTDGDVRDSENEGYQCRRKKSRRIPKICPVPGCRSKPQKKLSQHLKYKHPYLDEKECSHYLKRARKVLQRPLKRPPGQPTLHECHSFSRNDTRDRGRDVHGDEGVDMETGHDLESQGRRCGVEVEPERQGRGEDCTLEEENSGTRYFPRFDVGDPTFVRFERYLCGIDGGSRSEKLARKMKMDVSKFLRYACGPSGANWERLLDRDQLAGYVEKLKRASVGPEGQLSKLDALCAALRFVKVVVIRDAYNPMYAQATGTIELISVWKTTLRRQKSILREKRLSELSSETLSRAEITSLLDCNPLWVHFDETCKAAECNTPALTTAKLDQASVVLAGSLLYKNWQRPGAIVNATLTEFENANVVRTGDETVFVMKVVDHKTGSKGTANVVVEKTDHARIALYIDTVRKVQNTGNSSLLFLLTGGRRVGNLSSCLKALGRLYGLTLPIASRVRKIGATSVALHLDEKDPRLVTRQMSHSVATNVAYYQAIVGEQHAAAAYKTMSSLRRPQPEESPKACGTPRQRLFSDNKSETVKSYFSQNIESESTPTIRHCASFLYTHPLDRTPKNIQDKVKNLIRNASRK